MDSILDVEFVKVESETLDVKEECVEEEDPLKITSNNDKGDNQLCICNGPKSLPSF